MKRIVVLLTVVALMVMLLAMSVAPAFAARPQVLDGCFVRESLQILPADRFPGRIAKTDRNGDNKICAYTNDNGIGYVTDNNH